MAVAVCIVVVATVVTAWQLSSGADASAEGQWVQVRRQSIVQPLLLKGVLQPVSAVGIVSPANGRLSALHVQFGDKVSVGQVLAQVDSTELDQQLREAEIGMIRATQEVTNARRLEEGTEFQGAMRRHAAAVSALQSAQRRAAETQTLYDKGIIARTEVDGIKVELTGMASQVQAALDEIATLKLKRSPSAMRVLRLELENRRNRLEELQAKLRESKLVSPISGVVLYPIPVETGDASGGAVPKEFKQGAYVTSRDVLLTVGDTTAFLIKLKVDEADLGRIALRQLVSVTLTADRSQEFPGVIERISSQARGGDPRGSGIQASPEFEVQVLLQPPAPAPAGTVPAPVFRVGALATVKIVPQPGPASLLVPLQAVAWDAQGKPTVVARQGASGPGRTQTIEVGRTDVDGVEVSAGVAEGDEVWIASRPKAGPAPGLLHRMLGEDSESD